MTRFKSSQRLTTKPLGVLCSSLMVGIPMASHLAMAAPSAQQNPCPGVFYEEPFNTTRLVPQGCTPNIYTRNLIEQGQLSADQYNLGTGKPASSMRSPQEQTSPVQPTDANSGLNAIATIPVGTAAVDVKLKNNTNTTITYQVTGQTDQRSLAGGEEVDLKNLAVPTTFTLNREDGGFIKVIPVAGTPMATTQLMFSLDATGSADEGQKTVSIQRDGQVLAY